jgi:transcriptional regulator with XRE-family HTH domain
MSVSFGNSIRRGREAVGLSQSKVAQLIGKSPSTLRSWELGRSQPSDSSSVSAIAAVLGLDEHDLLGRAGFEASPEPTRTTMENDLSSLRQSAVETLPPVAAMRIQTNGPRHLGNRVPPVKRVLVKVDTAQVVDHQDHPLLTQGKQVAARIETWAQSLEQRLRDRPKREPRARPATTRVPRTSPPTPINPVAQPVVVAKSYLEDEDERDFYRRRAAITTVVVVLLFVVFWWSLRNTGSAMGEFLSGMIDQLDFS